MPAWLTDDLAFVWAIGLLLGFGVGIGVAGDDDWTLPAIGVFLGVCLLSLRFIRSKRRSA